MFLFLPPLTFFGLPLFCFSFSVSLFLLSFFLPSCLSSLAFFLFISCFCLFFHCSFFFAFVSWIEQHEKINCNFLVFNECVLFIWFPVLFSLWNLFFLSFFLPDFELCLLFNIIVFGFKKPKFKNTNFWSKGGLQHNGVFLSTCVLQNVKSYRFLGGAFFGQFLAAFHKTL